MSRSWPIELRKSHATLAQALPITDARYRQRGRLVAARDRFPFSAAFARFASRFSIEPARTDVAFEGVLAFTAGRFVRGAVAERVTVVLPERDGEVARFVGLALFVACPAELVDVERFAATPLVPATTARWVTARFGVTAARCVTARFGVTAVFRAGLAFFATAFRAVAFFTRRRTDLRRASAAAAISVGWEPASVRCDTSGVPSTTPETPAPRSIHAS